MGEKVLGETGLAELWSLIKSLVGGTKIQTGSYTGTGTYGVGNPCTLTFDFPPKFFAIFGKYANGMETGFSAVRDGPARFTYNSSNTITIIWSGNTISWYSTSSAANQFNYSGIEQYWLAIG